MDAKVHEFPGWEHGPEDATHFSTQAVWFPWFKLEGGVLYYSSGYPKEGWKWDDYAGDPKDVPHFDGAIARPIVPPIVIINGVEVDWDKAPEGTTHAMTDHACIRNYGQWRKIENGRVYRWDHGEWVVRSNDPKGWMEANANLFIEKPGLVAAAPIAKKEQPIVKKPVGWWA